MTSLEEAHNIAHQVEESIKVEVKNVYDIFVHVEPTGKCHDQEIFGIDRKMMKKIGRKK